jgi:membrane protease YdiL (CAAX protease family)
LSAGLKILAYLIGTVALGATFAPWLFWVGQFASHFRSLQFLANTDFQRFFNRSILLSAFLLLVPLLRWVGLDRLQDLGLRKNPRRLQHVVGGFLVSACTMSALGALLVGLDICELKNPLPWHLLPPIFLTAVSVACIEEALFRGAILGLVRQTISTVPAAISVSALFSIVHFLNPAKEQIAVVHWYSGFELLPQAFWKFSDPLTVLGGFITIGILGLILAQATIRTCSLWLGIGVHSGLVFAKMGFNKVTKKVHDVTPWFGGDITIGFGSVLVLLLLWFLVWKIYLRGKSDSEFA